MKTVVLSLLSILVITGCSRAAVKVDPTPVMPGAQPFLLPLPSPDPPSELRFGEIPAQEIRIAPPPTTLHVGERLKYQGRWMGIPVGWGVVEVREIVDMQGRKAFHIVGEAYSNAWLSKFYAVHDLVHSYLDAEELRPLRFEKSQREGHYRAEEAVTFNYARGIATYESFINRAVKDFLGEAVKQTPIPPHVQDPLSAFFALRLQPVTVGQPMYVDVYSDEKVFHTEIKVLKTLVLELRRRGVFDVIQVEPLAKFKGLLVNRGRVYLYLTADNQRVPLYIQLWTPWGLVTGTIDRETAERLRPMNQAPRRRRSATRP